MVGTSFPLNPVSCFLARTAARLGTVLRICIVSMPDYTRQAAAGELLQERKRASMHPLRTVRAVQPHAKYATSSDFCSYFLGSLRELYLLAFLLTGCHANAERCLILTAEECLGETRVFRGWESTWGRRRLVSNAIRLVFDERSGGIGELDSWRERNSDSPQFEAISAVTTLDPPLLRFAFVMSVLERYSLHDCALLLGCSPREVSQMRVRAINDLSHFVPMLRPPKLKLGGSHSAPGPGYRSGIAKQNDCRARS